MELTILNGFAGLAMVVLAFIAIALGPAIFGTVINTSVYADAEYRVYDITATADADTSSAFTHAFGCTPTVVWSQGLTTGRAWFLSEWTATWDQTTITFSKSTATGSGAAVAQIRVYARRRLLAA